MKALLLSLAISLPLSGQAVGPGTEHRADGSEHYVAPSQDWWGSQAKAAREWSDWHDSVVRVEVSGAGGSGSLVAVEESRGYVVTNAHVVGRAKHAVVLFRDGHRSTGSVVYRDASSDLALVEAQVQPGSKVIPIATKDDLPSRSDYVQLAGYGTKRRLTVWGGSVWGYSRRSEKHFDVQVAVNSESGDSGGPIVYRGKLIGVLWGWSKENGKPVTTQGCCSPYLTQLLPLECGPGGCRPKRGAFPFGRRRPPTGTIEAPPDGKKNALEEAIKRIRGLEAKVKKMGDLSISVGEVSAIEPGGVPTASIRRTDTGYLLDLGLVTGADGKDNTTDIEAVVDERLELVLADHEEHFVLVSSGSDRIEAGLHKARESYTPITHVSPAEINYTGRIPVLVAYQDRSPFRWWTGVYEVESALGRISRGDNLFD